MAALGASTTITSRGRGHQEQVVVSGDTIYSGALVGLGKASNTGYLVPWSDSGTTAQIAFLGLAVITVYNVGIGYNTCCFPLTTRVKYCTS